MEKWLRISLLPPWPTNKIRVTFGRDAKEAASKAFWCRFLFEVPFVV
jgi:hypothetical protein